MKKIALFIGRFQPWHVGHTNALERILAQNDLVTIVIGSAQESRTRANPWTVGERTMLIRQSLQHLDNTQIHIISLDDVIGDDEQWLRQLRKSVGDFQKIYSGNQWIQQICDQFTIPFSWIDYEVDISATRIRTMLAEGHNVKDYTIADRLPFELADS